jgi:hypothetical protein
MLLERENRSPVGGDLGGGSAELDHQLMFRPVPELTGGRTLLGCGLGGGRDDPRDRTRAEDGGRGR